MSESEARRFLKDLEADQELQSRLAQIKDLPKKVLGELQDRGYECTPEEVLTELMATCDITLDESQLEAIAAGRASTNTIVGYTVGSLMTAAALAAAAAA